MVRCSGDRAAVLPGPVPSQPGGCAAGMLITPDIMPSVCKPCPVCSAPVLGVSICLRLERLSVNVRPRGLYKLGPENCPVSAQASAADWQNFTFCHIDFEKPLLTLHANVASPAAEAYSSATYPLTIWVFESCWGVNADIYHAGTCYTKLVVCFLCRPMQPGLLQKPTRRQPSGTCARALRCLTARTGGSGPSSGSALQKAWPSSCR